MANPQNYAHAYNTRSKNKSDQSLKDVDGAIIAASPLSSVPSPFITPFTKSPLTTTTPTGPPTTQTKALSLFKSVVSSLFTTPKTNGPITTAATGTVIPATPVSVPQTVQFITPAVPVTWTPVGSTPTTPSVSTTIGILTSAPGTVSIPTTSSDSARISTPPTLTGTVSTPSTTSSAEPGSNVHSGTISGLTSASVIDLTSVPRTVVAATSVAAANLTISSVPSVSSGASSSTVTAQESQKNSQSKKMNFSLKLEKFSGKSNEDAKSWLMQFAQYSTCYGLDAETKANVFSFHLQDHARIWYNSLSDSIKNNWQSLEAAFKQRFTEDRDTLDLSILQINQSVNETVLDYLCRLQKNAALNPKVDEDLLLAIAVNGLRSEIRQIVINKEPKNFADLRRFATIAEKSIAAPVNTIQSLHETMINEIQTLKDQIHTINSSMNKAQISEPTPTVNQMMSGDDENDFHKFRNSQPSRYRAAQYIPRVVPQTQPRPNPYRQSYPPRNVQKYESPNYSNYREPQPRPRYMPSQTENTSTFHCPACGDISCNDRRFCRARSKRCNTCQRVGHFSSMCLSAKPSK